MSKNQRNLPHILLPTNRVKLTGYTSRAGGSSGNPNIAKQDPHQHGQKLLSRFKDIGKIIEREDFPEVASVKFIGEAGKDFLYEHLTNNTLGIELLSIKEDVKDEQVQVIANVQFSSKKAFETLQESIVDYSSNNLSTTTRRQLIECTSDISIPDFNGFFTDHISFLPDDKEIIWWEIWLNGNVNNVEKRFIDLVEKSGITCNKKSFILEDRIVVLVKSNKPQLSSFVANHPYYIAEIRRTKKIASKQAKILNMSPEDQHKLKDDILSKIKVPDVINTSIVILDTGINHAHPLIAPFLKEDDNRSYEKDWGSFDHHKPSGHGTSMSGLALYGNMNDGLKENHEIHVRSTLEGFKILPPEGSNDLDMYAVITKEAVDSTKSNKNKVYVMAVTNEDSNHNGQPTSWSASIDKIAFFEKRLFLISAGNFDPNELLTSGDYWNHQRVSCVEDPGQSWNAISVGAYTDIANADLLRQEGHHPFRNQGELSPYSRTSTSFNKQWPIKPEVLFEGGNKLVYQQDNKVYQTEDLSLVSCEAEFRQGLFCSFYATSAATALAGNFASELMAEYPNYWPETIRGLMVHSASWTEAMKNQFLGSKKTELGEGLRYFGYGVPNLVKAKLSGKDSLTLVSQNNFQLYKENEKGEKELQMMVFDLPWPSQVLKEDIGSKIINLKITLSYFVSPKAGNRGYEYKNKNIYRYQSFGLRFDLKRPLEDDIEFGKRVNKKEHEKDEKFKNSTKALKWLYGPDNRDKGSIHSDILEISGTELAEMNKIVIYPTKGWWDKDKDIEIVDMNVRFSLLVDIETEEVETDLYTSIQSEIKTPTVVSIS